MGTARGTSNIRVTFEGNSWWLVEVILPYEGAVRRTPSEKVGIRDGRVGMVVMRVSVSGHDFMLFRNVHGKLRRRRLDRSEGDES